jgi:hypothetical protein
MLFRRSQSPIEHGFVAVDLARVIWQSGAPGTLA